MNITANWIQTDTISNVTAILNNYRDSIMNNGSIAVTYTMTFVDKSVEGIEYVKAGAPKTLHKEDYFDSGVTTYQLIQKN